MDTPIATYKIPNLKRGDTFLARNIATLTQAAVAVPIYRARMELRTSGGELIYRWATDDAEPTATITGDDLNTVTLHAVEDDETVNWPLGNHVYDLEVWLEPDTSKMTILEGTMEVKKDTTTNG